MINELENITVLQFFSLPMDELLQQYNLLKMLRQSDTLKDKKADSILMQPYSMIVKLKKYYSNLTPEAMVAMVKMVFGIKNEVQMQFKIVEYFPAVNFIVNGLDKIIELEVKRLTSQPKEELIMAGVEKMQVYGDLNTIDQLAGGDMLKWNEIEKMPWQYVFTKLCMEKDRADIQESYSEIIRLKNQPQNAHS